MRPSLAWILGLGLAFRLWILASPGLGYAFDQQIFESWARGFAEHGLAEFYAHVELCDYPPILILLIASIGRLASSIHTIDVVAAIKAISVVADLGIGLLLYRWVRSGHGADRAAQAAALYVLNPAVVYAGAYWGQLDAAHTLFMLGTVVALAAGRPGAVGALAALAVLTKFQAITLAPIVLFATLRRHGVRALRRLAASAAVVVAVVLTPFLLTGTADDVVRRAYIDTVGQYNALSSNAFNLWYLLTDPTIPDTGPPQTLVRWLADEDGVASHPLLGLSFRYISFVLFGLAVLVVLARFDRSDRGSPALFGAAAATSVAFFFLVTEMHERYAFPALALAVPWAVSRAANERIYALFSALILLNLAAVLGPTALAPMVAVALAGVLAYVWWSVRPSHSTRFAVTVERAVAGLFVVGAAIWALASTKADAGHRLWLENEVPVSASQGWGRLRVGLATDGSPLRIGGRTFARGVGTHAPADLRYVVPDSAVEFRVWVGVSDYAGPAASAMVDCRTSSGASRRSERLRPGRLEELRLAVSPGDTLTIRVDPTDDGRRSDHVNLALAEFRLR